MGGMCLGSLLLPRYLKPRLASAPHLRLSRARHRRVRAAPAVRHAARRRRRTPPGPAPASSASCCAALSPASACCRRRMLMGATLPAIARWVEASPQGVVVARLLLRRQHGGRRDRQPARRLLPAARARHRRSRRYVGRGAERRRRGSSRSRVASRARPSSRPRRSPRTVPDGARERWPVYVAIGLSGMTALAAEVFWTRDCRCCSARRPTPSR